MEERMKEMEGRVWEGIENVQLQVRDVWEVASAIPPVEYTIHNCSSLKAQDKEWLSPPFYSHFGGYKMCMGVWPNGYDVRKGSHVSVVFYKMRDANTEGLRWPAKLPVTIHLLNQNTGKWQREYASDIGGHKASNDIELSAWYRPYLPHSDLAPYVKDDCLCIRVTSFTVK